MSGENVKLFVGNLPIDATHEELNKLFAPYGEINTCSLLRQYAFVTLKGEGAADRYSSVHCLSGYAGRSALEVFVYLLGIQLNGDIKLHTQAI